MATSPQQPMSYASQDGVAEQHQSVNQTPAFFLSNYRLGKTLGNGSFGKVRICVEQHQHSLSSGIVRYRKACENTGFAVHCMPHIFVQLMLFCLVFFIR